MKTSVLFGLIFTTANALTIAPRQNSVSWTPCTDNGNLDCGKFEVPLDYANSTAGTAKLSLLRYRATVPTKLGTIFLNPGGPGESGVNFLAGSAEALSSLVRGEYDLVSWDPRGVNNSEPEIHCFDNAKDALEFSQSFYPVNGIEARGNFTNQADIDILVSHTDAITAGMDEWFTRCDTKSEGNLKYIGTAAVVRDMVAMADALEGPSKPVNYWGFSYGTIIGAYFVNMFPSRVGRVIIDGVFSPEQWANLPAYSRWSDMIRDAEPTLEGFASLCAQAGQTNCALATPGATTASILTFIRNLIDKAYDAGKAGVPDVKSAAIRSFIFDAMYKPNTWPSVATQLAQMDQELTQALSGNNVTVTPRSLKHLRKRQQEDQDPKDTALDQMTQQSRLAAITCADAVDSPSVTTSDAINEILETSHTVSPIFGPQFGNAGFYCHRWNSRAVERFQGPWNSQLLNPILVIGNKADPVTPLASAQFVANALGNSAVLIEADGYGHTSLPMASQCTVQAIGNYFVNGTLPTQDIHCDANLGVFTGGNSTTGINTSDSTSKTTSDSDSNNNKSAASRRSTIGGAFIIITLSTTAVTVFLG
ncbi:hypothetical protein FRC03_004370 [Tulasnella sp. 419]|nr:hypothetical protein FRC03_004370 [Tulasnella sp. 419]